MTSIWKTFARSFYRTNWWHFTARQCLSMDHRTRQNVDYEQPFLFGEVRRVSKKKIDVSAPRGALGVTSMRRGSSISRALENYFSDTSLNIIFFFSLILFCLILFCFFFWFFVFDSRDGLRRKGGTARGVVTMRQEHSWHSHLKCHFFFDVICDPSRNRHTATWNLFFW